MNKYFNSKTKIISAITLLFLPQEADALGRATKAHCGLSIGAQMGYAYQNSRLGQQFTLCPRYTHHKGISGKNIIGGLYAAYGFVPSNDLFFGLEIKGDFTDLTARMSEGATTLYRNRTQVKMSNSFGGALKFGGIIYQVLPYVRVGILTGKWKSKTTLIIASIVGTNKRSKWQPGWELGCGVDVPLTPRFSVGGEFIHSEYKRFLYKNILFDPNNIPQEILKNKITPRTNTIMLRAKYRLC